MVAAGSVSQRLAGKTPFSYRADPNVPPFPDDRALLVFDGVYNDITNAEGFAAETRQSKAFGFDGKTLIHPSQVEPCNAIFAPPADAVQQARDVIAAFADPANAGKGVLKVNGRMTELLHLAQARRLVAVAEAIATREAGGG